MRSQPFASQASNRDFVYSGSTAITRTSVRTPASGSRTFGPLYHGMGPGGEGWGPAFPVLDCVKYVFWMFNAKTGTIVVKAKAMRANPRRSRSKKPAEHTNPDPVSGNRGRHLRTPPTQPGGSAAGAGLRRTPQPGRHRCEQRGSLSLRGPCPSARCWRRRRRRTCVHRRARWRAAPTGNAKTHSTPSHDDGVEHK